MYRAQNVVIRRLISTWDGIYITGDIKGGEFYQINHESNKISTVDISVPEQGINVSTEGRGEEGCRYFCNGRH